MANSVSHKKVIAFVSNSCWALYNFRLHVMQACTADGYKVLVLAPRDRHTSKLLALFPPDLLIYRDIDLQNTSINPFLDLVTIFQCVRVYKQECPSLIFHYATKPVIYGSLAAQLCGISSIAVISGLGYAFAKKKLFRFFIRSLFKLALQKCHFVWFLNTSNAMYFLDHHILKKEKMEFLPGEGIDTDLFYPCKRNISTTFTFIMVSRLLWSKGVGVYAEAIKILQEKGVHARFQLLGIIDPKHPDAVSKDQLQQWKAEGIFEYLGASDHVSSFLAKADCLVAPTYYEEGIPRSIMEALSMEVPVIATNQVGCKDLIEHGMNGYLCSPQNPEALAHSMELILKTTPEKRGEMGRKGRVLMKSMFDKDYIVEQYRRTIQKILS